MSSEFNILDIDNTLLHKPELTWKLLVKKYQSSGKEKDKDIFLDASLSSITIDIAHVLEYVGAFRKVVVDVLISKTIEQLQQRKDLIPFYSEYLNGTSLKENITIVALGSTNITSDYDLTLVGPLTYEIMNAIILGIQKQLGDTSTSKFDTNVYIAPDVRLPRQMKDRLSERISGIQLFESNPTTFSYVPIPSNNDVLSLEWKSVENKLNSHSNQQISVLDQYHRVYELGKTFDKIVYQNGNTTISLVTFWKLLL
jgi:hypothetical protein